MARQSSSTRSGLSSVAASCIKAAEKALKRIVAGEATPHRIGTETAVVMAYTFPSAGVGEQEVVRAVLSGMLRVTCGREKAVTQLPDIFLGGDAAPASQERSHDAVSEQSDLTNRPPPRTGQKASDSARQNKKAVGLGGGAEVVVDASVELPEREFGQVLRACPIDFDQLPADHPTVTAIAEAAYLKHLPRTSLPQTYAITAFPRSLLAAGGAASHTADDDGKTGEKDDGGMWTERVAACSRRFDVAVGGYVILSLATDAAGTRRTLRLFTNALDVVFRGMCGIDFVAGVLPSSWQRLVQSNSSSPPPSSSDAPAHTLDELGEVLEDVLLALGEYWDEGDASALRRTEVTHMLRAVSEGLHRLLIAAVGAAGGPFAADYRTLTLAQSVGADWLVECERFVRRAWRGEWAAGDAAPLRETLRRLRRVQQWRRLVEEVTDLLAEEGGGTTAAAAAESLWSVFDAVPFSDLENEQQQQQCPIVSINEEDNAKNVCNKGNNNSSSSSSNNKSSGGAAAPGALAKRTLSAASWDTAAAALERRLQPMEQRGVAVLRRRLAAASDTPSSASSSSSSSSSSLALQLFDQYRHLVRRPAVAKELRRERDALRMRLQSELQSIRTAVLQRRGAGAGVLSETQRDRLELDHADDTATMTMAMVVARPWVPAGVHRLLWLRQRLGRVRAVRRLAESTLAHATAAAEELVQLAQRVEEELVEVERETFEEWCESVLQAEDTLRLDESAPLMRITDAGAVAVNYPERLVALLKEVRILAVLDYTIPASIRALVERGRRYYGKGVALRQVAHVYNGMSHDILAPTRAMLLAPALAFEQIIEAGGRQRLTWRSTADTDRFLAQLRQAAQTLTEQNRRVQRVHAAVRAAVVRDLFSPDVRRRREGWQTRSQAICAMLHEMRWEHTEAWRAFWDAQMYKAMELHYRWGLEQLHEAEAAVWGTAVVRADVVVDEQTGQAVLRPPLEVIRQNYYERVRDFVDFPRRATGCGSAEDTRTGAPRAAVASSSSSSLSTPFAWMLLTNEAAIATAMRRASTTFRQVHAVLRRFDALLVIGRCERASHDTKKSKDDDAVPSRRDRRETAAVNRLEAVVGAALTEVQHWEQAVRLVKQKAKEVQAEELFVTCGRVVLCTASVKAAVEEQLARLSEVLTRTLRCSVAVHVARMEDYLRRVGQCLSRRIGTVAEIGEANMAYAALIQERMSAEVDFHHFVSKNALLQSMTRGDGGAAAMMMRRPVVVGGGASAPAAITTAAAAAQMQEVWTEAMQRLDRHESAMEQQLGTLQSSLREHVRSWQADVARVANQWSARKPRERAESAAAMAEVRAALTTTTESLARLRCAGEELRTQLAYFDMDASDVGGLSLDATSAQAAAPASAAEQRSDAVSLTALETEVGQYAAMWKLMEEYQTTLEELRQQPWIVFRTRLYLLDDFIHAWRGRLAGDGAGSWPRLPAMVQLRTQLERWGRCAPVLRFLRGDGFTPSHWSELFALLQLTTTTSVGGRATAPSQDTVTLGQILDKEEVLMLQEGALKKLQSRAQGEAQIREALEEVRVWAGEARFVLQPHPDRPHAVLITDWKDTLSALSDHYALLMSVKESPYYALFAADVNRWFDRLSRLDGYLRQMNQIQRRWVYLEPIFRRGALPSETERFNRVDGHYMRIMRAVAQDSHLLTLVTAAEDYGGVLQEVHDGLERCQRALNSFLEAKRELCPRFYFISDDDLLEILAQSSRPDVIQAHLKKLFMGIHRVEFDASRQHIVRVYSLEGEVVTLTRAVRVSAVEVESWLGVLDAELKATLKSNVVHCVSSFDLGAYASQVLCTAAMISFARETEAILMMSSSSSSSSSAAAAAAAAAPPPTHSSSSTGGSGGHVLSTALRQHKSTLQAQLREFTAYAGGNSDALMGIKLRALIMDLIHNMEVVDLLIEHRVDRVSDWLWRKQLRYYLGSQSQDVLLRMTDAQFDYTYEYQGNAPKLVHTPLTDRCYLTLVQGMQLGYGGNPYGPAGTGKTESVKALGNALGRQVLVFNCDEGIDFQSMGRLFTGLVRCGAWGCFDEFNRLRVDQLSAVSQMIQGIQEALKSGEPTCTLLGRRIAVNSSAGIFVTLNPAGKGYGGRSKLPDNLKQLFRSIAMSVPDNERIMETILLSEGFENARSLAQKTVEVFRLSAQLLSAQQHYDWGLRAMKAVLRLGGVLVHDFLMDRVAGRVQPSPDEVARRESAIIVQSLRVNTLAKLTFDDAVLFRDLLTDVFPGVAIEEGGGYAELRPALQAAATRLHLQVVPAQIEKMVQLYEALRQRMGVVLVGPSGSGKSTLIRVLRAALEQMMSAQSGASARSSHAGQSHHTLHETDAGVALYAMNPKAMPRDQLLGRLDPDTREWFDGVLTRAAREVVKQHVAEEQTAERGGGGHSSSSSSPSSSAQRRHSWILCDGDVDPEWVESLNSVLDDNKLLTMPNGVRIQFGDDVNFIFETHSLAFASPATVSRLGIIYLSDEDVDPRSAVATWLTTTQPPSIRAVLGPWMDAYLYAALAALRQSAGESGLVVATTTMGLVRSVLSQLQGCGSSKAEFALALLYGLGSYLPEETRAEFATELFHLVGETLPDVRHPLDFVYNAPHHSSSSSSGGGGGYVALSYEPGVEDGGGESAEEVEDGSAEEAEGVGIGRHAMVATVECQRALAVMRAWVMTTNKTNTNTNNNSNNNSDNTTAQEGDDEEEDGSPVMRSSSAAAEASRRCPFILVGPDGAGKSMLLHHLLTRVRGTRVVTMHCSAHTDAALVVDKLKQVCAMLHTTAGKVLRPKEAERLVLVFADLNLPQPDRYGTVQLHALLQQIIVYGGFYDTDLEWVRVERVQVAGSMTPPGTVGRHAVSPRLLAIASVLTISYPTADSLRLVYADFLSRTMRPLVRADDVPLSTSAAVRMALGVTAADVARAMTDVYTAVSARYTVDVALHYCFNPRDVTRWVRHVSYYPVPRRAEEAADVLAYEGRRLFVDRLTTAAARAHVTRLIDEAVGGLMTRAGGGSRRTIPNTRNAASSSSAAWDGPETRYYLSWAAAAHHDDGEGAEAHQEESGESNRRRVAVVPVTASELHTVAAAMLRRYTREYAELDLQLIPDVCAALARIDRVLAHAPFHLATGGGGENQGESQGEGGRHMLLLARAGVCATACVRLAAYAAGQVLISPSLPRYEANESDAAGGGGRSGNSAMRGGSEVRHFYAELRRAMLRAGVDGAAVVMLLEDAHVHHPAVLEAVHALIASGEVGGLFTPEEMEVALSALRTPAAEAGMSAYAYFTRRVSRQLHMVVVMDPTHPHHGQRLRDNPALLTRCEVCGMAAWEEASLRAVVPLLVPRSTLVGEDVDTDEKDHPMAKSADGKSLSVSARDAAERATDSAAHARPPPPPDEAMEKAVSALVAMHMDRVRGGDGDDDHGARAAGTAANDRDRGEREGADEAAGHSGGGRAAVDYSPQHFKALLYNLRHVYATQEARLRETRQRLRGGIAKLDAAQSSVDRITADVTAKQRRVQEKQGEADVALKEIQAKMEEAGAQKKSIHKIQKGLAKEQAVIEERKSRIERELSGIQPVLDAAMVAVSGIRADHLAELKSMKAPPAAVQDVMEGVIRLLSATNNAAGGGGGGGGAGLKEEMRNSGGSWAAMRKVLAGDIKSQILNLDLDSVGGAARAEAERLIAAKSNSFRPDVIGRASRAAAPMASWLQAVVDYSRVLETVAPMREELKGYEHNLLRGQETKRRYEGSLQKLEAVVQQLRDSFTATTTEAEALKLQLEEAAHTLSRAQLLLTRLSDEHRRWGQQVAAMTAAARELPRRCRLAAAFVTYLGNETEASRREQMRQWQRQQPPASSSLPTIAANEQQEKEKEEEEEEVFSVVSFLRDESVRLRYMAEGLPSDELSAENAVVMEEQTMTPMVEDPAGSVVPWLVRHLRHGVSTTSARATATSASSGGDSTTPRDAAVAVEMCGAGEERLLPALELALRFGKHFIITDVTRIERWWYPVLRREWRHEGSRRVVQLGDRRAVEWAESFRLYLITTGAAHGLGEARAHSGSNSSSSSEGGVGPDVAGYLTRINFALTQDGLEGYFLSRALAHEQPALEQQRVDHVAHEDALKRTLSSLEEQLLRDLAAAQGDLLENDALIAALQEVKQRASEIETALTEGAAVRAKLLAAREVYRPLATTARVVVVALKALPSLSSMYVFSFAFFTALFDKALAQERGRRTDAAHKVTWLQRRLVGHAVAAVSQSLRREHRVLVGLHLAHALHPERCPAVEWSLLLDRGALVTAAVTRSTGSSSTPPAAAATSPTVVVPTTSSSSSSSNSNPLTRVTTTAAASSSSAALRVPGFVLPDTVAAYRELAATLPALLRAMRVHEADVWLRWVRSATPEAQFPSFLDPLTPLQRLLVVKTLRPDRLSAAMRVTACALLEVNSLGDEDASAPLATRLAHADALFATRSSTDEDDEQEENDGEKEKGGHQTTKAAEAGGKEEGKTGKASAATVGSTSPPTTAAQTHIVTSKTNNKEANIGIGKASTRSSLSSTALPVVLLITSAGADASLELQALAHAAVGKERFVQLAMGGGQTVEAVRLLRHAAAAGEWLVLKNLHLVMDWVGNTFTSELTALAPTSHAQFRLFLTTEAHDHFPEVLLGRCVKMAVEAPPGVRQGMLRTFESWGATMYRTHSAVQRELLFAAAALHAVLQERRSYLPQGWTREYEITPSDIASFTDTVLRYSGGASANASSTSTPSVVDWRAIRGMLRGAIYGGKMETAFDERILDSYIAAYMSARHLSTGASAGAGSSSGHNDNERSIADAEPTAPALFPHLRVPPRPNFATAVRVVAALPESDVPEMFHLPPNADRAVQQSRMRVITSSLQRLHEVQKRQHTGTLSHEEWVHRLTPVLQAWATLTAPHPHLLTRRRASVAGTEGGGGGAHSMQPLERYVTAERQTAVRLVAAVDASVTELRRVVEGAALLTEPRRAEAACMMDNEVPPAWLGYFPCSGGFLAWAQALLRRAVAVAEWEKMGGAVVRALTSGTAMNLSLLLRARTFLNALRQETAHATKQPLVSLRLVAQSSTPPRGAALPVLLEGLLLQGAILDAKDVLQPIETADEPAFFALEKMYMAWVPQETAEELRSHASMCVVSVYSNTVKEEHVCDIELPCSSPEAVQSFILAGVSIALEQ